MEWFFWHFILINWLSDQLKTAVDSNFSENTSHQSKLSHRPVCLHKLGCWQLIVTSSKHLSRCLYLAIVSFFSFLTGTDLREVHHAQVNRIKMSNYTANSFVSQWICCLTGLGLQAVDQLNSTWKANFRWDKNVCVHHDTLI